MRRLSGTRLALFVLTTSAAAVVPATIDVRAGQTAAPTFNADVAPIVYRSCTTCHRPGAVGAMPLTSYREVRPWARSIKARVVKREMPPWSADPAYGHFKNDGSLRPAEIDLIARWVDAGAPEGTGPATPLPNYPAGGWRLVDGRPPDVVLEMPMDFPIPAEGQVPVFRMWAENPFKEDVFIQALQIQPTDPSVTHHSALYGRELPKGTTLQKGIGWKNGPDVAFIPTYPDGSIANILTPGFGFADGVEGALGKAPLKAGDRVPTISKIPQAGEEDDERLMFYLPGSDFQEFPKGAAKRIKPSNALMWELHYSPNGKPTTDRERIALWLSTSADREVHVIRNGAGQHIVENAESKTWNDLPPIPPMAADWKITAIQPFTQAATLASMQPHMHLRGKDMTYIATYPDGHEEVLLSVPAYDFNWQNTYMPTTPVKLPAGTVLKTVGHYDNSLSNKVNPQPYRPAYWSEQTWDEMYNAWTEITYDDESSAIRKASEMRASRQAASATHPIATFVGCAAPSTPTQWTLGNGARVTLPAPAPGQPVVRPAAFVTPQESAAAALVTSGQESLHLVGVSDFVTPEQSLLNPLRKGLYPIERVNATGALREGRRVVVKGVLIAGSPARLNLTSVVAIDGACAPTSAAAR